MSHTFFITGTDTEVGKTFAACKLLEQAGRAGCSTLGLKPIASGAARTPVGLRNEDALRLMQASSLNWPYEKVNPFVFEAAIAPHIAAQSTGSPLLLDAVTQTLGQVLTERQRSGDFNLIEGAGGWRVPLNEDHFFSDIPKKLNIPVILVVGLKLGCINHALLTVEAIQRDGLKLAGWIVNRIDPDMEADADNVQTLKRLISAPYIGDIPFIGRDNTAECTLDLSTLLKS